MSHVVFQNTVGIWSGANLAKIKLFGTLTAAVIPAFYLRLFGQLIVKLRKKYEFY
ncbi:hypothetical protein CRENPOLYSF1_260004 [Crenothrix polyspora]|uniref:Uncharacterized protein n=1 Tax=Crenothrix polyspora TaxID=360316 RepID=A0A1R4H7F3_9GAMM|nr:hypothetical protein CRENPOLYSF1_260004 [Crenothrix polyspora]